MNINSSLQNTNNREINITQDSSLNNTREVKEEPKQQIIKEKYITKKNGTTKTLINTVQQTKTSLAIINQNSEDKRQTKLVHNNKLALFSNIFRKSESIQSIQIPINKNFEKFYQELFTNFTKCNFLKVIDDVTEKFQLYTDKTNRWVLFDLILSSHTKFIRKKFCKLRRMPESKNIKSLLESFSKMQELIVSWTKDLSKVNIKENLSLSTTNEIRKIFEFTMMREDNKVKDSYDVNNLKQYNEKDSLSSNEYSSLDSKQGSKGSRGTRKEGQQPKNTKNTSSIQRTFTLASPSRSKVKNNLVYVKREYNIIKETFLLQKERLFYFNLSLIYFTGIYYYIHNYMQEAHIALISSIKFIDEYIDFQKSITEIFKRNCEVFPKCLPETYSVICETLVLLANILIYHRNFKSAFYFADMALRFCCKEVLYRESNAHCNIYFDSSNLNPNNNNSAANSNVNNNNNNSNNIVFSASNNLSYLTKEKQKQTTLLYLNIVTALYQRGVCYENFGNTAEEHLKAIENYKQSFWFAISFIKTSNPVLAQFISDVEQRIISKYHFCRELQLNKNPEQSTKNKNKYTLKVFQQSEQNKVSFYERLLQGKIKRSEELVSFVEKFNYNEPVENPIQYVSVLNNYQNNPSNNNEIKLIGTFDLLKSYKVMNTPMINKYKNMILVDTDDELSDNDQALSKTQSKANIAGGGIIYPPANNHHLNIETLHSLQSKAGIEGSKSKSNIQYFMDFESCLEQFNKSMFGFESGPHSTLPGKKDLIYYTPKFNYDKIKDFLLSTYHFLQRLSSKGYRRFIHGVKGPGFQIFKFNKNFQDLICNQIIKENYYMKLKKKSKHLESKNKRRPKKLLALDHKTIKVVLENLSKMKQELKRMLEASIEKSNLAAQSTIKRTHGYTENNTLNTVTDPNSTSNKDTITATKRKISKIFTPYIQEITNSSRDQQQIAKDSEENLKTTNNYGCVTGPIKMPSMKMSLALSNNQPQNSVGEDNSNLVQNSSRRGTMHRMTVFAKSNLKFRPSNLFESNNNNTNNTTTNNNNKKAGLVFGFDHDLIPGTIDEESPPLDERKLFTKSSKDSIHSRDKSQSTNSNANNNQNPNDVKNTKESKASRLMPKISHCSSNQLRQTNALVSNNLISDHCNNNNTEILFIENQTGKPKREKSTKAHPKEKKESNKRLFFDKSLSSINSKNSSSNRTSSKLGKTNKRQQKAGKEEEDAITNNSQGHQHTHHHHTNTYTNNTNNNNNINTGNVNANNILKDAHRNKANIDLCLEITEASSNNNQEIQNNPGKKKADEIIKKKIEEYLRKKKDCKKNYTLNNFNNNNVYLDRNSCNNNNNQISRNQIKSKLPIKIASSDNNFLLDIKTNNSTNFRLTTNEINTPKSNNINNIFNVNSTFSTNNKGFFQSNYNRNSEKELLLNLTKQTSTNNPIRLNMLTTKNNNNNKENEIGKNLEIFKLHDGKNNKQLAENCIISNKNEAENNTNKINIIISNCNSGNRNNEKIVFKDQIYSCKNTAFSSQSPLIPQIPSLVDQSLEQTVKSRILTAKNTLFDINNNNENTNNNTSKLEKKRIFTAHPISNKTNSSNMEFKSSNKNKFSFENYSNLRHSSRNKLSSAVTLDNKSYSKKNISRKKKTDTKKEIKNPLEQLNTLESNLSKKPNSINPALAPSIVFTKAFKKKLEYINNFESKELKFQKALLEIKSQEKFLESKFDSAITKKECERFFTTNYSKVKSNILKNSNINDISRSKLVNLRLEKLETSVVRSIENKALEKYQEYIMQNRKKDYHKIRKEFQINKDKEIDIPTVLKDNKMELKGIKKNIKSIFKHIINFDPKMRSKKLTTRKMFLERINRSRSEFYIINRGKHNNKEGRLSKKNKIRLSSNINESNEEFDDEENHSGSRKKTEVYKGKIDSFIRCQTEQTSREMNIIEKSLDIENITAGKEDVSRESFEKKRGSTYKKTVKSQISDSKVFNIFDYQKNKNDDDNVVLTFTLK